MTFWWFTPAFNVAPLSVNTLLLPAPPSQAAVSALVLDRLPAVRTPTPNKSSVQSLVTTSVCCSPLANQESVALRDWRFGTGVQVIY